MKYLLFIPFAILAGLTAGSWIPQRELTQLRSEVNQLKGQLESSGKAGKLSAFNSIIKIPEKRTGRKPGYTKETQTQIEPPIDIPQDTNGVTNVTSQVADQTTDAKEKRHHRRRRFPDPKSKTFDKDLQEAKELWETRVEIARSQWLAKLSLDEEGEQLFDEAIAAMNDKIYQTMEVVAEGLKNNSEMTSEAGLRVVNQVTETLVETYDGLREIVPDEKHKELEKMEMPDFIDPAAFEPLIDVSDKL